MQRWLGYANGSASVACKLLLDFVPNHTGLITLGSKTIRSTYISGTELDLARAPQNHTVGQAQGRDLLLASMDEIPISPAGRIRCSSTTAIRLAGPMIGELLTISGQCDGVRCDMAMLVLPDVFERTWGAPDAAVLAQSHSARVREKSPGFCFMAEVYWDMEWTLQQQGFDYTYDKRLYDRLRESHARPVRDHLRADLGYQGKSGPVPGKPRRAKGGHDIPAQHARCRSSHHVLVHGHVAFPSRTVRRPQSASHLHLVRAPKEPTDEAPPVLRAPARSAPATDGSRRSVAAARLCAGVGRQLDI